MNEKKINKNLLLIFKALCALVGATVGIIAVWQVFESNPTLVNGIGLKVVFYFVCGIVPAALLLLSAKPLLLLILSLCDKIKLHFKGVKAEAVAGVLFGIVIGMFFGFVAEIVMKLFLDIFALRIIISVVIAIVSAYFFALLCLNFVNKADKSSGGEDKPQTEETEYTGAGGYVLAGSALKSERIINVCENWLVGEIFVLKTTVDRFAETAAANSVSAEAARRYETLNSGGKITAAEFDCATENEDDRLISFALEKNLKILVENRAAVKETPFKVHILALDEL